VFEGDYQEFAAAREAELARAKEAWDAAKAREPARREESGANVGEGSLREERKSLREERKRAEELAKLEGQIAAAEAQLADCTRRLQEESEAQRHAEAGRLGEEYTTTQQQLEDLMAAWLVLAGD